MALSPTEVSETKDRLERTKAITLVETNAQAILEILRQLRALREVHRRRWIWELLQNAADATDLAKGKNKVRIDVNQHKFRFEHDGAPFDDREISHLIYHGSTKQGDPTKKGKFGSGFLTIHLIA